MIEPEQPQTPRRGRGRPRKDEAPAPAADATIDTPDFEPEDLPEGEGKGKPGITVYDIVKQYFSSKYRIRLNEVKNRIEFNPIGNPAKVEEVNAKDLLIDMAGTGARISQAHIDTVLGSSYVRPYNPLQDYFERVAEIHPFNKDEPCHIEHAASYVTVADGAQEQWVRHFKKHMVRAVACAVNPRYFNKQCLVIQGDKQNQGKTSYIRHLMPESLHEYISEEFIADAAGQRYLCENLIINLDELANLSRFEINQLKAMMAKTTIQMRLPYDRNYKNMPRRASFFGSTNKAEFLTDETGNVRWVVFAVQHIDFGYRQGIIPDKLWAQAWHLYRQSYKMDLSPDEVFENEKRNKQYLVSTPELDLILKHFELVKPHEPGVRFMTATDIVEHLQIKSNVMIRLNHYTVGRAMKMAGFEVVSKRKPGQEHPVKGYIVKLIDEVNGSPPEAAPYDPLPPIDHTAF